MSDLVETFTVLPNRNTGSGSLHGTSPDSPDFGALVISYQRTCHRLTALTSGADRFHLILKAVWALRLSLAQAVPCAMTLARRNSYHRRIRIRMSLPCGPPSALHRCRSCIPARTPSRVYCRRYKTIMVMVTATPVAHLLTNH